MPGEMVGSAFAKISLDSKDFESGMNSVKGKFSSFASDLESRGSRISSALGSALKTGLVAGTAAVGAALVGGTNAFADYEKGMASVSKTTGLTGADLKKLGDELRSMATAGPVTVGELEKIAAAAGSLGIESSKIGEFTKVMSDMAVAFEMDAETVTTAMADIGNVYGVPVEGMSKLGSQINALENQMSATAPQIIDFMSAFGGTAAMFGESAESTAAFGATLSELGVKGPEAATQLRSGILQLTQSTKDGQANMETMAKMMGISVAELADMIDKDLYGSLIKMGKTFKGIEGDTKKAAEAQKIFGAYGYSALIKLGDGADEYAEALGLINVKGNELTKEAGTMANTISGQWQRMKNGINDVGISIGEIASGPLKNFLAYMNDKAIPAIKEFVEAFAKGDWQKVGDMMTDGIRAGWEKLKDLGSQLLEWLKGVDYGPVGSYIASAISAAWQELKDLGSQLLDWLQGVNWSGVATTITDTIKAGWQALKDLGSDLAQWIKDYDWSNIAGDIADLIKAGWKKVKDWAKDIIAGLKADWDEWIAEDGPKKLGEDLGKAVAQGAKDIGKWIYDKIASWWKSNGSSLGGAIAAAIDFAKSAAQAAWDFAKSFGNTLLTAGKGTIGASILEVIGNAMNSAWEGAGNTLIDKAKEWRDAAEDLFAAEDFDATVDFKGIGDNPRLLDGSTIKVGVKFVEDGIGYKVSQFGDQFRLDKQVQGKGGLEWQTVSYHTTLKAAEDAAKITVDAATEASDTTTEAAAESAKTTDKASQGFKSTAEKANALTMGVFETSTAKLLSAAMQGAQAQQQAATATSAAAAMAVDRILIGSQTAANAIQQGAQVAANFATQAGQAVKIGLDASGREIAVIGQVAQQRFTQAGGELYNKVQVAGSGFQSAVQSGANAVNSAASNLAGAASNAASSLANAYASFASHNPYSGNVSPSYQVSRTISFSSSASSSSSSSSSSDPSWWTSAYTAAGGRAKGTETSGPELAIIGEAGREWVIPEKHKRWDLLLAAMRAYGIAGMAEGGAAGSSGATEATDADEMRAYFGIKGLASMSKQVQKIITDLKNFFRISWGIIKAEGSTYWRQISQIIRQEATTTRDGAWQAAIDIRNTWLSSNAQILADAKTSYEAIWPTISPSLESLRSSTVMTFEGINGDVANVMMSLSMNWSGVWDEMLLKLSDAQSQISSAVSTISTQLASISMNTSINITSSGGGGGGSYSGGGGGGGSGGMDWDFASDSDWLAPTGDWSEYGSSSISCGSNCNIGCEGIYNNAVISSTGPLATAGLGVDLMGGVPASQWSNSGSSWYSGSSYSASPYGAATGGSYSLPAVFRAKGALVDKGPELSIVGEAGPELILPANITRTIMNLADMGIGSIQGGGGKVVIEDHSVHKWYMDGKEVTNLLMDKAVRQLRLKGASPVR